ncbi:MAG TPA: hypothetical protein VK783_04820 [Bacteroidia bacterium]|nr:hypothetical protein [Bacteroidia bacterium]
MKKLFFAGMIMVLSLSSHAQYTREDTDSNKARHPQAATDQDSFWKHLSIGGGFGLQFGTITFVALSPLFNYHVTNDLIVGAGPMYQYVNNTEPYYGFTYSIYGGRISATYFLPGVLNNVALLAEYDVLNVPDYYSPFPQITRAYVYIPLLGIGFRRPIGEHSYYIITGMWDFSNSLLSPYANPTISAGVDFGM